MIDMLLKWQSCSDEDVFKVKRALISKEVSDEDVRNMYTFRVTDYVNMDTKTDEIYTERILIEVKYDGFQLYDIIIHCKDMIIEYGL
jgi:hypothetical protein